VYAKGVEYVQRDQDVSGKIIEEERAILAVGGRLHFTNEMTFSSSKLLNDHFSVFPPETEAWLRAFRKRYSAERVLGFLERTAALKAVVVGEAILDEYVFCNGLGKSTKEPILAFRYGSTEAHAGGSLAVANHLAGFCREVELICCLGERDRREDFIRQQLLPNVRLHAVTRPGAPTIHKRRFIDIHTGARVFELYVMDDAPSQPQEEAALLEVLDEVLGEADVAVVSDYGHGMLTPPVIGTLCESARFLAVNTQTNAGNQGLNTISRYPRADYVCLDGHEIVLETRRRHGAWRDLVLDVTTRINCPRFTLTLGSKGSLHYESGVGFTEAPALATCVADRVGAGDAVLAVTSLLVAQGTPWDVVGLIGNVVGAEMVAELGNRISVSRFPVTKHVMSLLK
jgi:bifunctional ADP-heptose synthase (sugar kinase/adenylyltransferase)